MGKHTLIRSYVVLGILSTLFVAACSTAERSEEKSQDYAAALKNSERPDTERSLDPTRKPSEVLAFYGVKKGDKVADIWAARGYYTAILSQVEALSVGQGFTQDWLHKPRDARNAGVIRALMAPIGLGSGAMRSSSGL